MDKIHIRDLRAQCVIGTDTIERQSRQEIVINIVLTTDVSLPAETDNLDDALNYYSLSRKIIDMVEISSYELIETLAVKIAEMCLENPKAESVRVTVDKPGAMPFARSVAVEITRERQE